ncbi:hypothetical protein ACFL40_04250 [candidate division KSB1 bacterium]
MKCNEITEIYLKSLGSRVTPEESAMLNKHLSECSECRQALKWDSAITGALMKEEQLVPKESFVADIIRQITPVKLPFKERVYGFIFSAMEIILPVIPVFVLAVLWMTFGTELKSVFSVDFQGYYDIIIYKVQSLKIALLELNMPDEILSVKLNNYSQLVWIGLSGLVYLVVSLTFGLSPQRRR